MWAVTLKTFRSGKGRLAPLVKGRLRAQLAETVARRVLEACRESGSAVMVVTPDDDITTWCSSLGIEVLREPPGGGLDGAATAVVARAAADGATAAILHADLPLLSAEDLHIVTRSASSAVIAPSRNGGTSLLAVGEQLPFHYGPDSFRHHLAVAAHLTPEIVTRPGFAVDLDTPADLRAAAGLRSGAWLRDFLDRPSS